MNPATDNKIPTTTFYDLLSCIKLIIKQQYLQENEGKLLQLTPGYFFWKPTTWSQSFCAIIRADEMFIYRTGDVLTPNVCIPIRNEKLGHMRLLIGNRFYTLVEAGIFI